MKINAISSTPSFGATPLMTCVVKDKFENERSATLYQMDIRDDKDYGEISDAAYKHQFYPIFKDFQSARMDGNSANRFYFLKTDTEDEPVAASETSTCYYSNCPNEKRNGKNTVIQEFAVNPLFVNPTLPMAAQIVREAQDSYSNNVITAFRADEVNLSKERFSEAKHENWILPKNRFDTLLTIAAKKAYVKFEE